jgi:8-oxo-dGTP diphosphatase
MKKSSKKYTYDYPHPEVTVDIVVVTKDDDPQVLLIRRKHDPFAGSWAIPGGFVNIDEPLEDAARRELFEETGLRVKQLEQLHTFGDPGRDPRGRTISVVYLTRVNGERVKPQAADDAAEVGWHLLRRPPRLAFDHAKILAKARERLRP